MACRTGRVRPKTPRGSGVGCTGARTEISWLPADECAPFENRERCGSLSCGDAGRKNQRLASPQDVSARQRNVVFPDTVQNEGRLWRNLASGKQRFTIVQAIGIALIFLMLVAIFWSDAADRFRFATSGSTFDRLVGTFGWWGIIFGLFGVFFLLLRWRVRRALLSERRRDRPR
jgi:hypothetical protein